MRGPTIKMKPPRTRLFPIEEYEQRLRNVRVLMERTGLDALLVHTPENIFYLTGYQTPGYYWHQALVLPLDSEPVFIAPPHEASLVPEFCWVNDVRLYPDTSDWAEVTAGLLEEMGLASARCDLARGCGLNRVVPPDQVTTGTGLSAKGSRIF